MPSLQQIFEEYRDQVERVAVNCGEEENIFEEKGYTFPVAYDEKNEIKDSIPVPEFLILL